MSDRVLSTDFEYVSSRGRVALRASVVTSAQARRTVVPQELIRVACRPRVRGCPDPPLSVHTAAGAPGPGPDLRTKAAAAPAAAGDGDGAADPAGARRGVPHDGSWTGPVPGTVPDSLLSAGY